MNRTELKEQIRHTDSHLKYLISIKTNCNHCVKFIENARVCEKFGKVPDEFILQGCGEWEYNDIPF